MEGTFFSLSDLAIPEHLTMPTTSSLLKFSSPVIVMTSLTHSWSSSTASTGFCLFAVFLLPRVHVYIFPKALSLFSLKLQTHISTCFLDMDWEDSEKTKL